MNVPEGGTLGTVIENLATQFNTASPHINTLTSAIAGLNVPRRYPSRGFKAFNKFITEEGGFNDVVELIQKIPTNLEAKLTNIKTAFDGFIDTVANQASSGEFKTAVLVAENMGKAGKVTVDGFPKAITMNVKVTLNADQVATALAKTGKLTVTTE